MSHSSSCNFWTFTVKKISEWTASHSIKINRFHTSWTKWYILAKVLIFLSRKKSMQNFLYICKCTQCVLINYKVSRNSAEWFKKSCAEVQKGRNSQKTRYVCEAQISPIMANFKDGLGHYDNYLDTSRKILSQEMLMCNMKALIFII